MIMNTITNEDGAKLIAELAKVSGKGFIQAREDVIQVLNEQFKLDVSDMFEQTHVAIAKIIAAGRALGEEKGVDSVEYDITYVMLALTHTIASMMTVQHTLHAVDGEMLERGVVPDDVRNVLSTAAASESIMERRDHTAHMVAAMVNVFMAKHVRTVGAA
jgi:hypothetical protein